MDRTEEENAPLGGLGRGRRGLAGSVRTGAAGVAPACAPLGSAQPRDLRGVSRRGETGVEHGVVGYHLTMRLCDDHPIARTAGELRRAARLIYRHGEGFGLLAFRIADTHLHVLLATNRVGAGRFARYVQSSLRQALRLPVGFERARIRPIRNPRHLIHSLRYVLRQEMHHASDFDPAHDGSSLPELLGMRRIGGDAAARRVRLALPRLRFATILEWAGAPTLNVALDWALLPEAAAAALGLPDLAGSSCAERQARCAASQLSASSSAQLAVLLGVGRRAIQRFRHLERDATLLRAVELQLRWRSAIAARYAARLDAPLQESV